MSAMIRKLHHSAMRCSDSEKTRQFYEDFLGLPLSGTLRLEQSATGRPVRVLHTFYRLGDGSFLAFFEVPDSPFDFKHQHDFDLHIALEVGQQDLQRMLEEGRRRGIETRGVSDHQFIHSIYFRDPDGYVIELTAKQPGHDDAVGAEDEAHATLQAWERDKAGHAAA